MWQAVQGAISFLITWQLTSYINRNAGKDPLIDTYFQS